MPGGRPGSGQKPRQGVPPGTQHIQVSGSSDNASDDAVAEATGALALMSAAVKCRKCGRPGCCSHVQPRTGATCRWFYNHNPDMGRFYSAIMVGRRGRVLLLRLQARCLEMHSSQGLPLHRWNGPSIWGPTSCSIWPQKSRDQAPDDGRGVVAQLSALRGG